MEVPCGDTLRTNKLYKTKSRVRQRTSTKENNRFREIKHMIQLAPESARDHASLLNPLRMAVLMRPNLHGVGKCESNLRPKG